MVERQLAGEGKNRRDMGREAFVERVWDWKQHYGGAILKQMKRLGTSVDWSREYFTMDERMSRAVREAFVRLYEEGLIYRGKYIVNWCPRCITAVSDLEVVHEETPGKLYEIRYPVVGSTDEFIIVATTRPETMLGDTAIAVNSTDERYKHLHGKKVMLPLMNREIPIITDDVLANPEFGTGAVKVTPSHDPNDFEAGLRNHLPQIEVMNEVAQMNENAGPYAGLDRFAARQRVLDDLEKGGYLVAKKDYTAHSERAAGVRPSSSRGSRRSGSSRFSRWPTVQSKSWSEVRSSLFRRITPRPTSSGCATSTTGASRGSCGGDIAFPRGTARSAARSSSLARRRRNANAVATSWSRTATCSTPGSPPACCPARRSAGPIKRLSSKRFIPQRC